MALLGVPLSLVCQVAWVDVFTAKLMHGNQVNEDTIIEEEENKLHLFAAATH